MIQTLFYRTRGTGRVWVELREMFRSFGVGLDDSDWDRIARERVDWIVRLPRAGRVGA